MASAGGLNHPLARMRPDFILKHVSDGINAERNIEFQNSIAIRLPLTISIPASIHLQNTLSRPARARHYAAKRRFNGLNSIANHGTTLSLQCFVYPSLGFS